MNLLVTFLKNLKAAKSIQEIYSLIDQFDNSIKDFSLEQISQIKNIVAEELKANVACQDQTIAPKSEAEVFLTNSETTDMLRISRGSLWKLAYKKKVLKPYSLPGSRRVYYKKSEIVEALTKIKRFKN